jgi:amino acid adenylation domain-containing protein
MSQQLPPAAAPAGYRVSPLQARLWLTQDAGPVARGRCVLRLDGPLDVPALQGAVRRAVARHEILRTTFRRSAGLRVPLQVIGTDAAFAWETADLSALPSAEQEARVADLLREDARRGGDLEQGPALRVTLVALAADRHLLVLGAPALCADARSLVLLAEEVCAHYGGDGPAEAPLQYADYAEWHHQLLGTDDDDARAAARYRERTAAAAPPRLVPFARRGAAEPAGPPDSFALVIGGETLRTAGALAEQSGAPVEALFLACWQALVARLTGEGAALVNCVLEGRSHADLGAALGLFARPLPIAGATTDVPLAEALGHARRAVDEAARWQDHLVSEADADAGGAGFEWLPGFAECEVRGVRFALTRLDCDGGPAALKLSCLPLADGCRATFSYDPRRIRAEDVGRIAGYFERLLLAALRDPAAPLGAIDLLDDEERTSLLVALNRTPADYPRHKTIHQLFEEQVERSPDRPALVCAGERLSYRELNERANRQAHYLRGRGVGRQSVVGLYLDRSADMIVGLLGVLKAGAAYMPLYHDAPPARLAQQLAQTRTRIVLTQGQLTSRLPQFSGEVFCLDRDRARLDGESAANPPRAADADDLVYVIFTSGSTGQPKGVATRHRNLVNYVTFIGDKLRLSDPAQANGLHFAAVSTFAADLGNTCIFPALVSGGCLHVVEYETSVDGRLFAAYLAQNPIDVFKITPSHLAALFGTGPAAELLPRKYLVLGGEAASWELVRRVTDASRCAVINHYGPTETTVGSLTFSLADRTGATEDAATVPIGRPIANTLLYVVDAGGRPVPRGVPGELWIGGDGVGQGYLNQPEQTAERFLSNPFVVAPGARLYRTGDRVRYLGDGTVEFLGRLDHQVKVRGFRVELPEVEAVLRRHPAVRQAVVTATTDNGAATRLAGYYVPATGQRPTPDDVRRYLAEQLPEYMVPATLTPLDGLPLTANGKVDYRALPDPQTNGAAATKPYAAPRDAVEEQLVAIWKEVLGVERVGVSDDFFDLGGHSLLATQVVSRIRGALGVQLPLRAIFESPTVAGLADAVRQYEKEQKGEEVDEILAELEGLSDEEVQRLLALEMEPDAGGAQ